MAATDTTTIRVPNQTRDRLKALAARRGESASEVVAKLVSAADEEAMLAEVEAGFERLAHNPEALAAYRAESHEIETAFAAPSPRVVDARPQQGEVCWADPNPTRGREQAKPSARRDWAG